MLDTDTKRRIDSCRDILVGKVPDPKSQVEQITIALIYKFMDDMDAEAEELGGKRSFFAGEYDKYGWAKLMRAGLGGHETLNLYAEAIDKMPENPGIPALFRDIFKNALLVPKEKIAANDEYNLSGERYRERSISTSSFPSVELGEVCELVRGVVFSKEDEVSEGGVQVLRANNINKDRYELNLDDIKRVSPKADFSDEKKLRKDDIFICLASGSKDHVGKVALIKDDTDFYFGGFMGAIRVKSDRLHADYLLKQLTTGHFNDFLREQIAGANINNVSGGLLYRFKIPLPPLEVQKEIVAEVEGYQKVIDGARSVLDNYRPHIPIHPDWPMVEMGEVCDVRDGTHDSPKYVLEGYPLITSKNLKNGFIDFTDVNLITREDLDAINKRSKVDAGDLLMPMIGTIGNPVVADTAREYAVKNVALIKLPPGCQVDNRFLKDVLDSAEMQIRFERQASGSTQRFIPLGFIRKLLIPLPPLATQQAIAAEIEAEQALVAANRELIARFEKKIHDTLARVWGE